MSTEQMLRVLVVMQCTAVVMFAAMPQSVERDNGEGKVQRTTATQQSSGPPPEASPLMLPVLMLPVLMLPVLMLLLLLLLLLLLRSPPNDDNNDDDEDDTTLSGGAMVDVMRASSTCGGFL